MKGAAARHLLTSIAANVRAQRLYLKWTQQALAEESDLTSRFVGEIERGAVNVRVVTLAALADALGVPPGTLMRRATKKNAKRAPGRPPGIVESRPRNRN